MTAFLAILAIYLLGNSLYYEFSLSQRHISDSERNAMHWIEKNTPEDSMFLVITGDQNAFCDMINEWFPSLTKKESLTTVQGSEWLLGNDFGKNMIQVHKLQGCIDEGLDCFTRKSDQFEKSFDYVYISIAPATQNCRLSDSSSRTNRGLIIAMDNAPEFSAVYRSTSVVIFEKR